MVDDHSAAFVIGGTGMLANATRWLIGRSIATMLVSRQASRFAAGLANTIAIDADWRDPAFRNLVTDAISRFPKTSRALLWLHDPGPVLNWLVPLLPSTRTVVVLGSMDGQPALPAAGTDVVFVRLGSKRSANGRRWLTHEEICDGAIAALSDGQSRIVGDLLPIT